MESSTESGATLTSFIQEEAREHKEISKEFRLQMTSLRIGDFLDNILVKVLKRRIIHFQFAFIKIFHEILVITIENLGTVLQEKDVIWHDKETIIVLLVSIRNSSLNLEF